MRKASLKRKKQHNSIQVKLVVLSLTIVVTALVLFVRSAVISNSNTKKRLNEQLNAQFTAMEVIANATQDKFNELLTSYASRSIPYKFSGSFNHTCYVSGEGYPGDTHSLICRLSIAGDNYEQYLPSSGLDKVRGQKVVEEADSTGKKLHYEMEIVKDETNTPISVHGSNKDCTVEVGYVLPVNHIYGDLPSWLNTTPALTYRLECQRTILKKQPGSFQIQCSTYYAASLPNGYECDD